MFKENSDLYGKRGKYEDIMKKDYVEINLSPFSLLLDLSFIILAATLSVAPVNL